MSPHRGWSRIIGFGLLCLLPVAAMAAGASRPQPRPRAVPDQTILLLEQEVSGLTQQPPDTVVYGGSREAELLRRIAAATRTSAQAQVELLRQQNEIIRLLEELTRARPAAR